MKTLTFLVVLFFHLPASSQQPLHYILLPTLDSTTSQFDFISTTDGGYVIPTYQSGVSGTGRTFIKTDATGNPLFAKQTTENIGKIIACTDGGFLMVTSDYPVIIKTDSAFNILWAKKIINFRNPFYSISIIEQDGNYYFATNAGERFFDSTHTHPTFAALIFKFDTGGNLVDQCILRDTISTNNHLQMYTTRLTPSSDGNIYLSVSALEYWAAGTCNRKPLVVKLDSDLNVIWAYAYPVNLFNTVMGMKMLANGNLLLYGDWGSNYPYCTYFSPYVQIIDSAGNVISARTYYYPYTVTQVSTSGVLEFPDQSILMTRAYEDTVAGHYVAHFDRLDSMGNTIQTSAFYFPYSQYYYNVNIAEPMGLEIPVSKLLHRDTLLFLTIDVNLQAACGSIPHNIDDSALFINRYGPGMEPIAFLHAVSDTVLPPMQSVPVSTSAACPTTAIPDPVEWTTAVYPVPAKEMITIGNENDYGRKAFIKIISMNGTELIGAQIHLPQQVDVSSLLPGIYILQLNENGIQSHRKLIIG